MHPADFRSGTSVGVNFDQVLGYINFQIEELNCVINLCKEYAQNALSLREKFSEDVLTLKGRIQLISAHFFAISAQSAHFLLSNDVKRH